MSDEYPINNDANFYQVKLNSPDFGKGIKLALAHYDLDKYKTNFYAWLAADAWSAMIKEATDWRFGRPDMDTGNWWYNLVADDSIFSDLVSEVQTQIDSYISFYDEKYDGAISAALAHSLGLKPPSLIGKIAPVLVAIGGFGLTGAMLWKEKYKTKAHKGTLAASIAAGIGGTIAASIAFSDLNEYTMITRYGDPTLEPGYTPTPGGGGYLPGGDFVPPESADFAVAWSSLMVDQQFYLALLSSLDSNGTYTNASFTNANGTFETFARFKAQLIANTGVASFDALVGKWIFVQSVANVEFRIDSYSGQVMNLTFKSGNIRSFTWPTQAAPAAQTVEYYDPWGGASIPYGI